jgi:hypothetical protein
MYIATHVTFMYRINDWVVRNPMAFRAITVGLALAAAAAALLLHQDISWACPNGGGGCGA